MQKKLRIAFIIPSLAKGGAERVVVNLANYMAKALKYNVTVIISFEIKNSYKLASNVYVHNINCQLGSNLISRFFILLKKVYKLRNKFKQEKYDRIFSFMDESNIACCLTRFTFCASVHNNLDYIHPLYKMLYFLLNKKNVKHVICLTSAMERQFHERGIKNTVIIPNPLTPFSKAVQVKNLTSENFVLAVGRLHPQKNFPLLIQAYAASSLAGKIKLYIAGEGKEKQHLLYWINQLNLMKEVKLLGLQNNEQLKQLYSAAFITVMSSDHEGFGNVLIESLSLGTPVISTDCPQGPADIIMHGKNGLLVPVGDSNTLAKAMNTIYQDKEKYNLMKKNAAESVKHLLVENIASKWLAL